LRRIAETERWRMDRSASVTGVRSGRIFVYFCTGEFRRWLFESPGIGHEGDGVARPREAIEVAEFGLDRLEGEMKRPVEVLWHDERLLLPLELLELELSELFHANFSSVGGELELHDGGNWSREINRTAGKD